MYASFPSTARPRFEIDADELFQILISIFAICLSLALVNAGLKLDPGEFAILMAIFALTVGPGFILHEMAHKYFAIKYGAHARFTAWTWGLGLMLALAIIPQLLGIQFPLFLAPGAVMIYAMRPLSSRENGIISLAGPATNIAIAMLFFVLGVILMASGGSFALTATRAIPLWTVALIGLQVNLGLAAFNLLPFFPLDGAKVMAWNWKIWLAAFLIAFLGAGSLSGMLG
ncbi:MAG: site-2 protease family protein [Candidatus Micrarchaeota archaeon]